MRWSTYSSLEAAGCGDEVAIGSLAKRIVLPSLLMQLDQEGRRKILQLAASWLPPEVQGDTSQDPEQSFGFICASRSLSQAGCTFLLPTRGLSHSLWSIGALSKELTSEDDAQEGMKSWAYSCVALVANCSRFTVHAALCLATVLPFTSCASVFGVCPWSTPEASCTVPTSVSKFPKDHVGVLGIRSQFFSLVIVPAEHTWESWQICSAIDIPQAASQAEKLKGLFYHVPRSQTCYLISV